MSTQNNESIELVLSQILNKNKTMKKYNCFKKRLELQVNRFGSGYRLKGLLVCGGSRCIAIQSSQPKGCHFPCEVVLLKII